MPVIGEYSIPPYPLFAPQFKMARMTSKQWFAAEGEPRRNIGKVTS